MSWAREMLADVAVIGDSRGQDGVRKWKTLSASNWDSMPTSGGSCVIGISNDANNNSTLEYRAADKNLRWTAPGDTAGPWTLAFAGRNTLASATAGYEIELALRSFTELPATDKTISTSTTGTRNAGPRAYGFAERAFGLLRFPKRVYKMLAVGGATASGVVEMLPWLETQATGAGVDIIILSTNDITNGTSAATVTGHLQTIYDARRALGRKLVIVGETARWGVNTSTALTAGQITLFDAIRTFQQAYAAAHPQDVSFVDTYPLTYDSGQNDRRPATGMLRDTVHPANRGAQVVGAAIAAALRARNGQARDISSADTDNLFANGFPNGSSGTVGTGCTGVMPTSWTSSRQNSNVTCATSVVTRDDGYSGNALRVQASASGGAGYALMEASSQTLAALGLSVGDAVLIECSFSVRSASGLNYVRPHVYQTGVSPNNVIYDCLDAGSANYQGDEDVLTVSAAFPLQTGCTALKVYFWIDFASGGSADVYMNALKIVKIA